MEQRAGGTIRDGTLPLPLASLMTDQSKVDLVNSLSVEIILINIVTFI